MHYAVVFHGSEVTESIFETLEVATSYCAYFVQFLEYVRGEYIFEFGRGEYLLRTSI